MDETASCLQQCQNRQQLVPVSGQKPKTQNFKGSCRKQLFDEPMNVLRPLSLNTLMCVFIVSVQVCMEAGGRHSLYFLGTGLLNEHAAHQFS